MGANDPVVLGYGEKYTGDAMAHRSLVDIFYKEQREGNPYRWQNKDQVPGVFDLQAILQDLTYEMNQVLNYHCSKTGNQTHETREYIKRPVS
jgi:hypothetical protein